MEEVDTATFAAIPDPEVLLEAISSLSEGIAVFGADRRLIVFNKPYFDMFGPIQDLIRPGVHWGELMEAADAVGLYEEDPSSVTDYLENRDRLIPTFKKTFELRHSDGRIYSSTYNPTSSGGFVIRRTDITERRMAEKRLKDSEHLLKTVLDTIPIAIVMARKSDGKLVYRSQEAMRGWPEDAKFAQTYFVDPKDREAYVAALEADGVVNDHRVAFRRADGTISQTMLAGRLVDYGGEEYVVSAMSDYSERLSNEELLRHVVEACPTPLTMTRLETGELLYASPEARAMFGDQDSSKTYYAEPGARDRYVSALQQKGFVNEYKMLLETGDGRHFWSATSSRLIRFRGEDVIVAHVRDLSEQIAIEEELDQQRELIFQNEKMSALGELLAGVAHELNNPLSVVVGHSLMLLEDEMVPEMQRHVEKISAAANRCARIVRTFLTMARQEPSRTERVRANEIVRTAVDVAGYGESAGARVEAELEPFLPEILADADQITQVVLNLVLNSEQAILSSGKGDLIRVATRHRKKKGTVEILIEDNGPGIPKELRGRVFEPFFTTKKVGEGTGIGLALCHRIVHSHGGTIKLDTSVNEGTRFVIALPVSEDAPAHSEPATPTPLEHGRSRILIVDDESDVAELNGEILSREGYVVDVTNSVDEGLGWMRDRQYDLILSDLNMPDRDGRALFEEISQDFPEQVARTGFVTGDTMGQSSQNFLREAKRPFLEKPVTPSELVAFAAGIIATAEETQA